MLYFILILVHTTNWLGGKNKVGAWNTTQVELNTGWGQNWKVQQRWRDGVWTHRGRSGCRLCTAESANGAADGTASKNSYKSSVWTTYPHPPHQPPVGASGPRLCRDPVSLLALPWPRCNDELRTSASRQRAPHHQLFCLISPVQPRAPSAQPNSSFQVVLQLQLHRCDPGTSAGAQPGWLPGTCTCAHHRLFSLIINECNEALNIKCNAPNVLFMKCSIAPSVLGDVSLVW